MPDDSMVPVTDDLVARLRDRINGTGVWRTAGPDEDMQALVARITTLERELAEAQTLRHKAEYHAGVLEAQNVVLRRELAADLLALKAGRDALVASKAEVERLRGLVETAFRDGLSYGTDVVVTDPDEAWRTSRVRAALTRQGETG